MAPIEVDQTVTSLLCVAPYVKFVGPAKTLYNAEKHQMMEVIMTAYACGSGGVIFVPDKIEKTLPKVVLRRSNDNQTETEQDGAETTS